MADLPRMTDGQYSRARRLIHRLCANCDGGNCLPLDDGDACPCPQLLTPAVICKYFRAAVLPDDGALFTEIMGKSNLRYCASCGRYYVPTAKNSRFCKSCAAQRTRRSKRDWAAKSRLHRRKNSR